MIFALRSTINLIDKCQLVAKVGKGRTSVWVGPRCNQSFGRTKILFLFNSSDLQFHLI